MARVAKPGKPFYMATNEYGETLHGLTSPRAGLMRRLGTKYALPIYVDLITKDGGSRVTGYYTGGRNWQIYEVTPWLKAPKGATT